MAQHADKSARGVVLPSGHTGSSLFHELLTRAIGKFPAALGSANLPPHPGQFKREYGDVLPRFEAARVRAPERLDIARFLVRETEAALRFADDSGQRPLSEYLSQAAPVPVFDPVSLPAEPALRAEVPFEGKLYRGREIEGLLDRLADAQHLTLGARAALRWIVDHIERCGGSLDLRGESFVVLGAGAELAATRLLLQAGARVLWIDVADPSRLLASAEGLAGTLVRPEGAANLLEQPREIGAAIRGFAEQHGPVHLAMFAYASGSSREWRLGAAMTAIATHLPRELLRSVTMLVSPTTTATLQPECVQAARAGLERPSRWKS
ncbi:MAG TPA: hypothetical protein VJR89_32785, partial [Polyangiales bacterium]|nr:hypothetical protein [Polyangiales bacterium]